MLLLLMQRYLLDEGKLLDLVAVVAVHLVAVGLESQEDHQYLLLLLPVIKIQKHP